jgi:hypothetical protein
VRFKIKKGDALVLRRCGAIDRLRVTVALRDESRWIDARCDEVAALALSNGKLGSRWRSSSTMETRGNGPVLALVPSGQPKRHGWLGLRTWAF